MIILPGDIKEAIFEQGRKELPNEACGYLAGRGSRVFKRFALTNADASPEHFSFDPKEQFEAYNRARAEDLRLIAVYHTHPETPARPSEEDIRLAADPDIVYIIASLAGGKEEIKAFRIKAGEVTPLSLEVKNHE